MEKNHFFSFGQEACGQLTEQIFFQMSGIKGEGKKAERMRRAAMEAREKIEERIDVRAAYAFYNDVELSGRELVVDGQTLVCSAFEQIDKSWVRGVCVYALSAGNFSFPEDPIMEQLFADIWGSAFADAVRMMLKEEIEKTVRLSDGFGPGFYGMDVKEMTKLACLVDLDHLEMQVRDNGILLPLKSCAGLYLCVSDGYQALHDACRSCLGNHSSCQLCSIYGGR